MNNSIITEKEILEFEAFLRSQERERATIEKYLREVRFFAGWMDGRPVTKEAVIRWKESLQKQEYVPATINAKLSALNGSFLLHGMVLVQGKISAYPAADVPHPVQGADQTGV